MICDELAINGISNKLFTFILKKDIHNPNIFGMAYNLYHYSNLGFYIP